MGRLTRSLARTLGGPEVLKLFAAKKRRRASQAGPGRRAPTPHEAWGDQDENYYWTVHGRLWDELVPPSDQAKTVQGELIRITGKLTREAYTNGNINWRPSCTLMWRFVGQTLDDPDSFDKEERTQIQEWVKSIIRDRYRPDTSGEESPYYRVTEKAVAWEVAHPKAIRHVPDPRIKM